MEVGGWISPRTASIFDTCFHVFNILKPTAAGDTPRPGDRQWGLLTRWVLQTVAATRARRPFGQGGAGGVLARRVPNTFQPRSWHRVTLAAVAGSGIALSAILAVHFSNTQIEERRNQLIVDATGFADDLEQYLQSREMIAKQSALFLALLHHRRLARFVRSPKRFSLSRQKLV